MVEDEYKLDGLNLIKKIYVLPWEAYFGVTKVVETLSGNIKIKIQEKIERKYEKKIELQIKEDH